MQINAPTSDAELIVRNPATGEFAGRAPSLSPAEVHDRVTAARRAQSAWWACGFAERARLLRDLRAWLVAERRRVVTTMSHEGGRAYEDALVEFTAVCAAIGYWTRHGERLLREQRRWGRSPINISRRIVVRYEPLGVVGVIGPWNYPLALCFGDAIPALLAGNTVVLKPSGIAPLSTMLVAEGARAVGFPDNVLVVATGRGAAGEALVDTADMIQFTGSTATGRRIASRAGARLIPASVELGGKDAMIVLADANVERAARTAVLHAMVNSGQTCMSVERVYVEAPVYERFVSLVLEQVQALRQGAPSAPGAIDVGALCGPGQADIVEEHVRDAIERGARVLCGGTRGPGEHFYSPTVLVDVDHTMRCMTEETFGPTLPIMRVHGAEEAIRLVNDSEYGLNSSVFTASPSRGEAIARQIQAGSSCVNDALVNFLEFGAPMTGWKQSGLGGRHGPDGIRKFCRQQTIVVTRFTPRRDPIAGALGYPRSRSATELIGRAIGLAYARPWRVRRARSR